MSYTPYTPQSWNANTFITPTVMNHIEAGIKSNSDGISSLNTDLAKRFLTYPTSLYSGTHGWDIARATTLLNWISSQTIDGDYGVISCNNGYQYSGTFVRATTNDIIVNFDTYRTGYSGYLLQKASGVVTVSQFAQKGEIVVDEDVTVTNTFGKVKTISMPNTPKLVYASMSYNASQPVSIGLIQIISGYNYLVGYTERYATSDFQGTSSVTVTAVTSVPTLDIYARAVNTSGVNKITYGYIPLT